MTSLHSPAAAADTRPRQSIRPEDEGSILSAGSEAGRPPRLCRACGAYGAWNGSNYCCCQCRDTGGRLHGLWCSQGCPGPGVANCTIAIVSSFTLAAKVGPDLSKLRSKGRLLTRVTASEYIQQRKSSEEARLERLFRDRFGWQGPDEHEA